MINILKSYHAPIVYSGGIVTLKEIKTFEETLTNKSNGVSIGRAFHNFIASQEVNFKDENLAFASKFEYISASGKQFNKSLSPVNIKNYLES